MDRARNLDVPSSSKSSKKAARKQHKIQKARKPVDNTQKKLIDAKPDPKPSDVLRKHIESLQEKSASSHSSDLPQEQLEKLIEVKKQEKADFESAFKDLQSHIQAAKSRISEEDTKQDAILQEDPYVKSVLFKHMQSKLTNYVEDKPMQSNQEISLMNRKNLEDLFLKDLKDSLTKELTEIIQKDQYLNKLSLKHTINRVNKQISIIKEHYDIKEIISKDVKNTEKEMKFLLNTSEMTYQLRNTFNTLKEHLKKPIETDTKLFRSCGIDLHAHLIKKDPEPPKFLKVDNFYNYSRNFSINRHINDARFKLIIQKVSDFHSNSVISQFHQIAQLREIIANCQKLRSSSQKNSQEIQGVKLSSYDRCQEELNSLRHRSPITQDAKKKFEEVIDQDDQAIREAYRETLQTHQKYGGLALQILNLAYRQQLKGEKINKEKILKDFQNAHKTEEDFQQYIEKILKESDNVKNLENEDEIIQERLSSIKDFFNSIDVLSDNAFKKGNIDYRHALSFYDFIGKNITHRLPNSLDELEKKCQEALRLFDEEIKKLEWLHSEKQSELSDQPQKAMKKPSPADKLQTYFETALKDADMTDQWKRTLTSYMRELFEKSHPQSPNEATIAKFYQTTIEEAKQVATYIEQRHFIHYKIREDVLKFAIHLKHEFDIPFHQARIDADFNIIQSDRSKEGSSSISRLEISPQGKILKDGIVQRVYLIGLQDSSEASSSDADAKSMALLAIQSTDPGYLKFGAGTPLPTGGVVDVVTAQSTTRDQPNLYKATLAIETLQETHGQKDVDLPKLELFETETVMHPHTKAPLYDVATFVGTVKDKPPQALPENTKQEQQYQETTGPCMVSLDELTSAVKQELGLADHFRPSQIVMQSLKRQIARQVLGKEKVPTSDQEWKKNGAICWADFHEYSTSMNMFAKYLVLAYREELGLVK